MEVNPLVLLSCCVGWVSSSDAMGHPQITSSVFSNIWTTPSLCHHFFTPNHPLAYVFYLPPLKMWTSYMYVPYGNSIQTISRDSHYEYARFSLARLLHKYEQVNIGKRKENMNIFDFFFNDHVYSFKKCLFGEKLNTRKVIITF